VSIAPADIRSQSLLFRSVFPFAAILIPGVLVFFLSQSLLFRSVFPFYMRHRRPVSPRCGRNPFYSGRFFHSNFYSNIQLKRKVTSQSLLFRSVFPFPRLSQSGKITRPFVAIPSIQVGFSIQRSFFVLWQKTMDVAIPSIQVGFSIQ